MAQVLVALWGALTIVFVLSRLSGDPARLLLGPTGTEADLETIRADLGLSGSIVSQYGSFLAHAARGDFGDSIVGQAPALQLVLDRLPATLWLGALGAAIALIGGVVVGMVAAQLSRTGSDNYIRLGLSCAQAMPSFAVGVVLILVFSEILGWLPAGQLTDWKSVILPAIALGWVDLAGIARMTRASMLVVLDQDYMHLAASKGLSNRRLYGLHALGNAAIPIMQYSGIVVAGLLSGSVIVETLFAWPGVGSLLIQSVSSRDFPVVEACVLVYTLIFVGVSTVIDMIARVIAGPLRTERLES